MEVASIIACLMGHAIFFSCFWPLPTFPDSAPVIYPGKIKWIFPCWFSLICFAGLYLKRVMRLLSGKDRRDTWHLFFLYLFFHSLWGFGLFPISVFSHLKCIVNLQAFIICFLRTIRISVFLCLNYVYSIYCYSCCCKLFSYISVLLLLGVYERREGIICSGLLSPLGTLMGVARIIIW